MNERHADGRYTGWLLHQLVDEGLREYPKIIWKSNIKRP